MNLTIAALSRRRRLADRTGHVLLIAVVLVTLGTLAWLLAQLFIKGWPALSWTFLTAFPSRRPSEAGIGPSIVGTLWIGFVSMLTALPLGIGAAVYLNEFAGENRLKYFLRSSILNLAGVPSVVFGILGLAIFVRVFGLGVSIIAASFTLALLTLPYIVIVAEESLKQVPREVRDAAFALGASRWEVVRHHVLPYSLPGMLTASILALSRSMGETAPLIIIGASAFLPVIPTSPFSRFQALPIQIYNWASHSQFGFHELAWGATLVLVLLTLTGNLAAIFLRDRAQRRIRW
jgi:phosphate transport system permease protein